MWPRMGKRTRELLHGGQHKAGRTENLPQFLGQAAAVSLSLKVMALNLRDPRPRAILLALPCPDQHRGASSSSSSSSSSRCIDIRPLSPRSFPLLRSLVGPRPDPAPQADASPLDPPPPLQAELVRQRARRRGLAVGRGALAPAPLPPAHGPAGGPLDGQARAADGVPGPGRLRTRGGERGAAARGQEPPLRRRQPEEVRERSAAGRGAVVVRGAAGAGVVRRGGAAGVVGWEERGGSAGSGHTLT
ncbi:hypothetical protein VTK73DRAFT_5249 [Phialemonium thermophilum]|uniref:Uncharacterized protein n=1 Tax=Phialemonium thermophilum TaxID=223376 RepID=A0ABR3V2G5_9PEZI